jgi:multidrug efflux pump subunit AcrA (membrane-fusion protein)
VKGDHVERHAVKAGTTNGAQTQVLAGLTAGDTVVVAGPADLKDGETVAIKR